MLCLQGALRGVVLEADVRQSYEWLERLARNPYADDDSAPAVPGGPAASSPPVSLAAAAHATVCMQAASDPHRRRPNPWKHAV